MAANLLGQGWRVEVRDIDPAKVADLVKIGAVALSYPAHAANESVAFIICAVDAAQTEAVLFGPQGLSRMLQPGHAAMPCPTMAPQDVESFASRLLQALSNKVFHISEKPGDGARTKLVNNLLAGIYLVGAAEVLALAACLGLDPGKTLDVIEQSSGQSWIGSDRMRRALAGDYAPRAHVTLLEKDTRLAIEAARAAGFEGRLGARVPAKSLPRPTKPGWQRLMTLRFSATWRSDGNPLIGSLASACKMLF